MSIPPYLISRNQSLIPAYLHKKKVEFENNEYLPDGVEWDELTLILFKIGDYRKAVQWLVKNKRPVLVLYEGKSGEGKTSLVIDDHKWFMKEISGVDVTTENILKYFLLGREITLDPSIIRRYYKKLDFIIIDEAHLMMNRYRAVSVQNRDANRFADMMREAQIYLLLTSITQQQLDSDFVNYKLVLRIIAEYNNYQKGEVHYRVQLNATGMKDGKRHWEFVDFQRDQTRKWCDKDMYNTTRQLKYDKGYQEDIASFISDKDHKARETEKIINTEAEAIVNKYDDDAQIVAGLFRLNIKKGEMILALNEKHGYEKYNYTKLKPLYYRATRNLIKLDDLNDDE